jgi:hypothetical protein
MKKLTFIKLSSSFILKYPEKNVPYIAFLLFISFNSRTNIVEAHIQLQSLLKSEYSAEEMQSIVMRPIPDLQSQLDSLL